MKTLTNGILVILFLAACSSEQDPQPESKVIDDLSRGAWALQNNDFWEIYKFESEFVTTWEVRYYEHIDSIDIRNQWQETFQILENNMIALGTNVSGYRIENDTLWLMPSNTEFPYARIDLELFNKLTKQDG